MSPTVIFAAAVVSVWALAVTCFAISKRIRHRDDLMDLADVVQNNIRRDEIAELEAMFNAPAYVREDQR